MLRTACKHTNRSRHTHNFITFDKAPHLTSRYTNEFELCILTYEYVSVWMSTPQLKHRPLLSSRSFMPRHKEQLIKTEEKQSIWEAAECNLVCEETEKLCSTSGRWKIFYKWLKVCEWRKAPKLLSKWQVLIRGFADVDCGRWKSNHLGVFFMLQILSISLLCEDITFKWLSKAQAVRAGEIMTQHLFHYIRLYGFWMYCRESNMWDSNCKTLSYTNRLKYSTTTK